MIGPPGWGRWWRSTNWKRHSNNKNLLFQIHFFYLNLNLKAIYLSHHHYHYHHISTPQAPTFSTQIPWPSITTGLAVLTLANVAAGKKHARTPHTTPTAAQTRKQIPKAQSFVTCPCNY